MDTAFRSRTVAEIAHAVAFQLDGTECPDEGLRLVAKADGAVVGVDLEDDDWHVWQSVRFTVAEA